MASRPPFNPDLEGFEAEPVLDFRSKLRSCRGVLIASPEYAHGITGSMKNALDWVVASGEFINKPVALLNTSSRATLAQESLQEILKTMAAKIVKEASLTIPLPSSMDREGILAHPELSSLLRAAIAQLINRIISAIDGSA